jgi:hypothetical protein
VSNCINRRKLVPERVDRGGTLRYAWLRAPPLRHAIKIKPKPQLGRLTQEAPYEGGQKALLRSLILNGGHASTFALRATADALPTLQSLSLRSDSIGAKGP